MTAAACVAMAARALAAQSPADRAMLVAWDDSLRGATTTTALAAFDMAAVARQGDAGDIRLALYELRREELSDAKSALAQSLQRLDGVARAHPDWPWPTYVMSRAFFTLARKRVPVGALAGAGDGESPVEAAWRLLHTTCARDASFAPARKYAADLLVLEGDRELRADELAVLRTLLKRPKPEGDLYLVWGRDLRRRGKVDSAETMFDRAAAAGSDRSRLAVERARTLDALRDTVGAVKAYWDGLAHLTPTGREMYRFDLAWILAPDSLKLFDRVPDDSLAGWVHRFWDERDVESANRPGARLQEHFRRWNVAFSLFRVLDPWRRNQMDRVEYAFEGIDDCVTNDSTLYNILMHEQPAHDGDPRSREPLIDHRGLVYLHHGTPSRIVYGVGTTHEADTLALGVGTRWDAAAQLALTWAGPRPEDPPAPGDCQRLKVAKPGPNEAWLYWIDGAARVINFRPSCALGLDAPTTVTSYLPVSFDAQDQADWIARSSLTQVYHDASIELTHPMGRIPITCHDPIRNAIVTSRADAAIAASTDSYTPRILYAWGASIFTYALGSGADRSGEMLVTFAIPRDSVKAIRTADGRDDYAIATRISAFERNSGKMLTLDTVRHLIVPDRAAPKEHLSGWFEIALDPGDWDVSVRMKQNVDSSGAYMLQPHLEVDGDRPLALSDVVLGRAEGPMWPAPDGANFPVNVLGLYDVGGTAELYYEVRGLHQGDMYQTTIEARSVDSTKKDAIRVVTTDHATGAMTPVRKALGLERLAPGDYRVTVTVDAEGRKASRVQEIFIVKKP